MAGYVWCRLCRGDMTSRFRRLERFGERLVGLLGTQPSAEPVMLCRCESIHTFGMKYAIDVAFVRRDGYVLLSKRSLGPCRLLTAYGSYYVLERPASQEPWPTEGALVELMWTEDERE